MNLYGYLDKYRSGLDKADTVSYTQDKINRE